MEARRRKLELVVLGVAAIVVAFAVPSAQAGADGTAEGTLTLNGTTIPLKYAYASAKPAFFDKGKEDIHILLSDVPLTDEQRDDVFELIKLARAGQARVVEVVLDADARPISGAFFAQPFEGMVSATGMHQFEQSAFEHKRVAGRLSTDGARTFQHVTYEYAATFSAIIPRPPTAEEVAAALVSPPGQAAAAYVTAILDNNLTAFLERLSEPAAAAYRGAGGQAAFAALRAETPADSKVVGLTTPTETTAIATIDGTRDGIVIEAVVELALVDGTWKVTKAQ
jgi:hypothetical protein